MIGHEFLVHDRTWVVIICANPCARLNWGGGGGGEKNAGGLTADDGEVLKNVEDPMFC